MYSSSPPAPVLRAQVYVRTPKTPDHGFVVGMYATALCWLAGLSRAQCSAGGRDSPGTVELPPTTSRCSPGRNPHHHHATARGARPIHHPHPAFPFGIRPDHHVAVAGDGVRPRRRWARLRGTPPVILQMGRHARPPSSPTLGLLVPRR
jgi:hypothetical protein